MSFRQRHLNRQVALATGEDYRRISRMGFSPVREGASLDCEEAERPPQIVDWDQLALERNVALFERR